LSGGLGAAPEMVLELATVIDVGGNCLPFSRIGPLPAVLAIVPVSVAFIEAYLDLAVCIALDEDVVTGASGYVEAVSGNLPRWLLIVSRPVEARRVGCAGAGAARDQPATRECGYRSEDDEAFADVHGTPVIGPAAHVLWAHPQGICQNERQR
jgi:hypothetical protein